MFGRNVLMAPDRGDGAHLWVQSLFPTIQGEGPLAGTPALFLRLAGCNLRCHFCDTDFESSQWRPDVHELLDKIESLTFACNTSLVVITGGEPLRQNVNPLLEVLLRRGYRVQFETAGTVWVPQLENVFEVYGDAVSIVCSPKTGGVHPQVAAHCTNWKYIVRVGDVRDIDGLPMQSTQADDAGKAIPLQQRLYRTGRKCDTVWLQPCEEYRHVEGAAPARDEAATKRNVSLAVALAMRHGYRVSLQLHKVLGLP